MKDKYVGKWFVTPILYFFIIERVPSPDRYRYIAVSYNGNQNKNTRSADGVYNAGIEDIQRAFKNKTPIEPTELPFDHTRFMSFYPDELDLDDEEEEEEKKEEPRKEVLPLEKCGHKAEHLKLYKQGGTNVYVCTYRQCCTSYRKEDLDAEQQEAAEKTQQ